ncbi:uncharacterized protein LOC115770130 isoform X1 [Drosophila novamexicana]|uniref:uncharacterized protein LOC115770130 isoform X1 n=2 Tax=Drosophila novamexicana TaxID=47314 RepID=UPI0011E5F70A|nr:uncharacterized protein LOC115770130 isoform X1 [Drosophila novamexicana]
MKRIGFQLSSLIAQTSIFIYAAYFDRAIFSLEPYAAAETSEYLSNPKRMTENKTPKYIFDFQKLIETFTEICPDFCDEPSYANATVSRRFAEQVIFECSKQVKLAKRQGKNELWKLTLETQDEQGKSLKNKVIITMNATKPPPQQQPLVVNGILELTFKQASLLAVAKYCQMMPHLVKRQEIVLTPLAGAVFAKEDMPKLAAALGQPLPELLMAIISSCQTDGYYLEHSRCDIAVAVLIKTVSDFQMRTSIIKKTIKMYKFQGKELDMAKFKICNKFVQSSNSAINRPIRVDNEEVDNLVSQIMSFNLNMDMEPPSYLLTNNRGKIRKHQMKCAARFHGQLGNPAKK